MPAFVIGAAEDPLVQQYPRIKRAAGGQGPQGVHELRPAVLLDGPGAGLARAARGGSLPVSCYLCAYMRAESPEDHQPLPSGSPVSPDQDLGTCYQCSVWACSAHGTRYGKFECAICTPATAAEDALTAAAVGGPAAVVAHLVGMNASGPLRNQVAIAMQDVVTASQEQVPEARSLVAPGQGPPNLITNLAEAIRRRRQYPPDDLFVFAVHTNGEGFGLLSLDAIGGAVRARFTGRQLSSPNDDAVTTATGALLLGYSLADPEIAARRRADQVSWPEGIDSLRRPWEVPSPMFLDPVLWMLGTALPES